MCRSRSGATSGNCVVDRLRPGATPKLLCPPRGRVERRGLRYEVRWCGQSLHAAARRTLCSRTGIVEVHVFMRPERGYRRGLWATLKTLVFTLDGSYTADGPL